MLNMNQANVSHCRKSEHEARKNMVTQAGTGAVAVRFCASANGNTEIVDLMLRSGIEIDQAHRIDRTL